MPEDVFLLLSAAYDHKVRAAYHRRRLKETLPVLEQRCQELGIPVPELEPKALGLIQKHPSSHSLRRQSDPSRPAD